MKVKGRRAPKWARLMMREYGVDGWNLGHAMYLHEGKLKCFKCGEYVGNTPPCFGGK